MSYKYGGKVRDIRVPYVPMSRAEAKARFEYFRKAEEGIYLGPEIRPRNQQPVCGTYSGYVKHRKTKETPCRKCMDAGANYQREYRAKKRAA